MTRMLLTTTALVGLLASPAFAQSVTPEQARAVEGQLRNWAVSTLGPDVKLGERPVQVVPDADRYRVSVPFKMQNGAKTETYTPTATMRPLDGGRWSIDSFTMPLPARFSIAMPQPPREGQRTAPPPVTVNYVANAASQTGRGVWDPTYATVSTFEQDITGFKLDATGTGLRQASSFDRSHSVNTIKPAGDGRVDMVVESVVEGYSNTSKSPDTEELMFGSRAVRVSGTLNGVSRDNATTALQQAIRLLLPVLANPPKPGVAAPKPDMKATRTLIAALGDFASEMDIKESVDDLRVTYAGAGGTAKHAQFNMGGKSVQGILQAYMELGADDIALPTLPLGPMEALVPTRVALRPVISGAATQDVVDALLSATEGKDGPSPEAFQKVFSRGGVSSGLESFLIEVGGAVFKGNGAFVMTTPQTGTGKAQIIATNFDGLQAKVSAIPQMGQVMPVFVFLKGLGKSNGNDLVWDVTYDGGKLLVNGTDMSAMTGR